MIKLNCIQKIKDNYGNVVLYKLQYANGNITEATSDQLKKAIQTKQVEIVNLTLTKDNRLIDKNKSTKQTLKQHEKSVILEKKYLTQLDLENKEVIFKSNVNMESMILKARAIGTDVIKLNKYMYALQSKSSVIIVSDRQIYFPANCSSLFSLITIKSLDMKDVNTSKTVNMDSMFYSCKVDKIDISNFNTSNVTNMKDMFMGFETNVLDIRHFDTSKVKDMAYMFCCCRVNVINLNFDTSNVLDVYGMFKNCKTEELDLSSFVLDKNGYTNSGEMFKGCKARVIAKDRVVLEELSFRDEE